MRLKSGISYREKTPELKPTTSSCVGLWRVTQETFARSLGNKCLWREGGGGRGVGG